MFIGIKSNWHEKVCIRIRYIWNFSFRWQSQLPSPPSLPRPGHMRGARVSTTVASHTRLRPARHGIIVRPSGLLPSVRIRPGGSLIDGMPALERERCMMSLMVLCRGILPKPREQDNPWLPIRAPQAHMCGSHIAAPRRKPTATRLLLLLLLSLLLFYQFYCIYYYYCCCCLFI